MAITGYFHATPAGAGAKTGADWANAFDIDAFRTFMVNSVVAGNIIFFETGTYTYTFGIDWNARKGTAVSPIVIIGVTTAPRLAGRVGVNILKSDYAVGNDRPFIDGATFRTAVSDYNRIENIYFQSSEIYNILFYNNCTAIKCKFDNDYDVSAIRYAVGSYPKATYIECEFTTSQGKGNGCSISDNTAFINCTFDGISDSSQGKVITINVSSLLVAGCNFKNCFQGMFLGTTNTHRILNNTFYNCGRVISATTAFFTTCINNIVEGCTIAGFEWTTQTDSNFFSHNHGDDARNADMWVNVDVSTVFKDQNVSTGDPKFTTPGSDHSLLTTSPCIGTGLGLSLGVGAGGLLPNKGAWSPGIDEAARNVGTADTNILTGASIKIQNVVTNGVLVAGGGGSKSGMGEILGVKRRIF